MNILSEFAAAAERNENVWISDVRSAFENIPDADRLIIRHTRLDGGTRDIECHIPRWETEEGRLFAVDYLTARIFNLLSVFSAQKLELFFDETDERLSSFVSESLSRFSAVSGLKKPLNVAARLSRTLGKNAFSFQPRPIDEYSPAEARNVLNSPASNSFDTVFRKAEEGLQCGIDVGGTDIKLALSLDGKLIAIKEYDWDPSKSKTAGPIIEPIVTLTEFLRAYAACAAHGEDAELKSRFEKALGREAELSELRTLTETAADLYDLPLLDGIGLSYPDVVINDTIVGGETPKTKGIRENPDVDYEAEMAELAKLNLHLEKLCRNGAKVRAINDGAMAAFSAATEEYAKDGCAHAMIAHSLGTDLGTGVIDGAGNIPQLPMECYDLLVDLGSRKSAAYPPEDLRSVRNENSGLAGARRYLGQAAVYRLVSETEPALLDGFAEEKDGIYRIISVPADMRKPALESIMRRAAEGESAAQAAFRQIGVNLGKLTLELEYLLESGIDRRPLFGRFVKSPECFALIREGAAGVVPGISFEASDDSMAYTPLMRQLATTPGVTVAQFAQAISAIYFAGTSPDSMPDIAFLS